MNDEFIKLYKEFYGGNLKTKNIKIKELIDYLMKNYCEELDFYIIDLIIYCLSREKINDSKMLVSLINSNNNLNTQSIIKNNEKYNNSRICQMYGLYENKRLADYLFVFISRYKYESLKLICLLTLNKNGFIRLNAMKHLSNYDLNDTTLFYLLRLNDWVEVISKNASEYLINNLNETNNENINNTLDIIIKLENKVKNKELINNVLSKIDKLLSKSDINKLIYAFEKSDKLKIKRKLIDYIVKYDDIIVENYLKNYRSINDNYVNLQIIHYLEKKLSYEDYLNYLKNNNTQYASYLYLSKVKDIDDIYPFLFHKSLSIQRYTRALLKNYGNPITVNDYLDELNNKNFNQRNVLRGLIDICSLKESEIIKQYLESDLLYAKKQAFERLCTLGLLTLEEAKEFLESTNTKYTVKILIKYKMRLDVGYLINLYQRCKDKKKNNLINLIAVLSKWDALEGFLNILMFEKDRFYISLIYQFIKEWDDKFNRYFILLTNEQKARLKKLINNIDNKSIKELLFRIG